MTRSTRPNALVALALVATLAFPVGAVAVPRVLGGRAAAVQQQLTSGAVAARARAAAVLEARIAAVLERRRVRFDAAQAAVGIRVQTVRAIAEKLAAAGIDVSSAKRSLDKAQSHLDGASTLEAQAVAGFREVPASTTPLQTFQFARGIAVNSRAELVQARVDLRLAIAELHAILAKLGSAPASSLPAKEAADA